MLLRYSLIFIALISITQVRADEFFQFYSENNTLTIHTENPPLINFLAEFSRKTKIEVRYDSSISENLHLPAMSLTVNQLIRTLDSQFSTIKTFNDQGNLNSLDVLPLGDTRSGKLISVAEMLKSNNPKAQNTKNSIIPSHIDINNVQDSDWGELTKEQSQALKEAIKENRRKENSSERMERKIARDTNFMNSLEELKEENPELHAIMLERYKARLERIKSYNKHASKNKGAGE
mgnify:CR=1 FL=1|jgi:hypothetical protein|tara:strand:+ start:44 stop:745 length:702 start_codon:yes stop_codon:yes gene_type:complete